MAIYHTIGRTFSDVFGGTYNNSLKVLCARNSFVLGIGAVIAKGLNFVSKVVLTRLVAPRELGIMVLILSITSLFEAITEIGLKQSVIQNKDGAQMKYLNTVWWFQCFRRVGLYVAAFLLAPLLCHFYFSSKPEVLAAHSYGELSALVRVSFLAIFFWGFMSPGVYVLEKEFKFGRAVIISQGSTALGAVVTIILAFFIRNVWALAIGFASIGLAGCLLSHIICPFRPRFVFDRRSFQEIAQFARGIAGLPTLTYIAFNIDILIGSKLVATGLIGMYGFALSLAQTPRDLYGRIVSPVLLPAFAQKQNDNKAICKAVLAVTKFTGLIYIPLMALAVIFSRTVLAVIFQPEYSTVAIPFSLLCVYMLFLLQGTILGTVLFGIGQPSKHRFYVVLRVLILVVLMYPAIKLFGLTGAAALLLIASFISLCAQVVVFRKLIGMRIRDYITVWIPGLALAVPVAAAGWLLKIM